MEKRVPRSRACKEIEKENALPQLARRNRRAISTIECQSQHKAAKAAAAAAKTAAAVAKKAPSAAKMKKFSDVSSQTDNCLVSTIQQLTQELIAKGN